MIIRGTYDKDHPPLLHNTIEEQYGSLILNNNNYEDDDLPGILLDKCAHLIPTYSKEQIADEIESVLTYTSNFPDYTNGIIVMSRIKELYINLACQEHAPYDADFDYFLLKSVRNDPLIIKYSASNTVVSYLDPMQKLVSKFTSDVKHSTRIIPITKPYLNYIPSTLANDILHKHIRLVTKC